MTHFMHGKTRYLVLLAALVALAFISDSASAQARKPAVQKEPVKVEQQEEVPDKAQPALRRPEGLKEIADRIPEMTQRRRMEADCSGTETVQFMPIDAYPLLLLSDDGELGGRPYLRIKADVSHSAGRVFLSGSVTISEKSPLGEYPSSFDTAFRTSFGFDSIVLKRGCVIDEVSPSSGEIGDNTNDSHDWEWVYGAGLIEKANCRQDTRGDDEGKVGCKSVSLRPITVTYRKADEEPECESVKIQPRTGVIFPLTAHRPNQNDMDGNRVDVSLDSEVKIVDTPDGSGEELQIISSLKMTESIYPQHRGMRAYKEGGQRNVFLTAFDAPGCRIAGVRPAVGTLRGKSSAGDHDGTLYGRSDGNLGLATGMIDYAHCRTDTAGEDSGKIGCTEIVYKPLTIILEKE